MKLQIALDLMEVDEAVAMLAELDGLIDIAEIGTPMILRKGLAAVKKVKKAFPDLDVLADLKIMDGGRIEADDGFKAGASYVTVMAAAHDSTIRNVAESARRHGGKAVVDLLAVPDPVARARAVLGFGAEYACVHTASDQQAAGHNPLGELAMVAAAVGGDRVAVAGGIKLASLPEVAAHRPGIVIVGSSLTGLPLPEMRATAEKMRRVVDAH